MSSLLQSIYKVFTSIYKVFTSHILTKSHKSSIKYKTTYDYIVYNDFSFFDLLLHSCLVIHNIFFCHFAE